MKSSDTHSLGVFTVEAQQFQRAVLLQRPIQIPQLVVHPGDHAVIGQTLTARAQTPALKHLKARGSARIEPQQPPGAKLHTWSSQQVLKEALGNSILVELDSRIITLILSYYLSQLFHAAPSKVFTPSWLKCT